MTLENEYKLTAQELYRRFIFSLPSEVTREYYHRCVPPQMPTPAELSISSFESNIGFR
jgi:hypothetical protein